MVIRTRVLKKSAKKKNKKTGLYFLEQSAVRFVNSGCQILNCCLGGGWPIGRIINIVGDKSSGKTLLAIEACANFHQQYPKGNIYYLEAEAAFDKRYAQALGMPVESVIFIEDAFTVEDFFEVLSEASDKTKESEEPSLFILDSLDALSDAAELNRAIDKGSYGAQKAKKLSELFRKLVKTLNDSQTTLIIISQIRDKIGVTFGRRTTRSGGNALNFYAAQIVYLAEVNKLKKVIKGIQRVVGVHIKAKVDKNKVGLPYRECDFDILFGFGIDSLTSNLNYLVITKTLDRMREKKLSKNTIKRFVASAMKDSNYMQICSKSDRIVSQVWREIETEFLPPKRKYE